MPIVLRYLFMSLCFLFVNKSLAAVATGTLTVTANVAASCTVTTNGTLNFGGYNPSTSTPLTASTSSLSVNCTNGANYTIGLDKGGHGTSTTTRQMIGGTLGTVLLNYQLCRDAGATCTLNWGNSITTPIDVYSGTGTGTAQAITINGQIPAGQTSATSGGYTDTVNVTVNY